MSLGELKQAGPYQAKSGPEPGRSARLWRKAVPYLGTVVIFAFIFWRIPVRAVVQAFRQAPLLEFAALFSPFIFLYWLVDSFCLTWVVRRFNAPMTFREIAPIRASMYILALLNTNLGQGGVAYYLHRKGGIPLLDAVSSILFLVLMEIYQLLLFSTAGLVLYAPATPAQARMVRIMRPIDAAAWAILLGLMAALEAARRSPRACAWVARWRFGALAGTFLKARPRDYAVVLALKAPNSISAIVAHYFALRLFGIAIPFVKLMLFLPLVFVAASLPVAVAHLGTSQAAWLLFFSSNAPAAKILAYSLAAHFIFMATTALIGVVFLPRATRELATIAEA